MLYVHHGAAGFLGMFLFFIGLTYFSEDPKDWNRARGAYFIVASISFFVFAFT